MDGRKCRMYVRNGIINVADSTDVGGIGGGSTAEENMIVENRALGNKVSGNTVAVESIAAEENIASENTDVESNYGESNCMESKRCDHLHHRTPYRLPSLTFQAFPNLNIYQTLKTPPY